MLVTKSNLTVKVGKILQKKYRQTSTFEFLYTLKAVDTEMFNIKF